MNKVGTIYLKKRILGLPRELLAPEIVIFVFFKTYKLCIQITLLLYTQIHALHIQLSTEIYRKPSIYLLRKQSYKINQFQPSSSGASKNFLFMKESCWCLAEKILFYFTLFYFSLPAHVTHEHTYKITSSMLIRENFLGSIEWELFLCFLTQSHIQFDEKKCQQDNLISIKHDFW